MVMLGIGAERVFLLLCASLEAALANPVEKARFTKLLRPHVEEVSVRNPFLKNQMPDRGYSDEGDLPFSARVPLLPVQLAALESCKKIPE
jgi:hypothetical protein